MLSDKHLRRHIVEWFEDYITRGDSRGGGHAGLSLNVYCALTKESPRRVASILLSAGRKQVVSCTAIGTFKSRVPLVWVDT